MDQAWITVEVRRYHDGPVIITHPRRLAGTEVITNADAETCGLPGPMERTVCGLVAGHECEHWTCSDELVAQSGPFALRRVTVTRSAADTPADETHPTKGD